jgi:hypothetical protein
MNQPQQPMTVKHSTDQKQMNYLQMGIGGFVTLFSGVRLVMHYFFGITISGYSRKFGYFDENLYWVFFVIGVIWLGVAIWSYIRFMQTQTRK